MKISQLRGVREVEDAILLRGINDPDTALKIVELSRKLFGIAPIDVEFDLPDAYWDYPENSPERIAIWNEYVDYDDQFVTGDHLQDVEAMEELLKLGVDFSDHRGQPLKCTKALAMVAEAAARGIKGQMPDAEEASVESWEDSLASQAEEFQRRRRERRE